MSKKNYFKKKRFNAAIRSISFRNIPNCKVECKCNSIIAYLPIRYENGKYKYKLKITVDTYGYYKCFIVEPKISFANGNPPHIYFFDSKIDKEKQIFNGLRICLHLPQSEEYDSNSPVFETIISWAIKWTEFYELWLLTGSWHGGGQHVTNDKEKSKLSEEYERQ